MRNPNWTREEHILAFNLYCKIEFTKINAKYQPVKDLAVVLGRSNGSVAMKLANFARLDPALKARNVSGLTQGAKGEEVVWNEFRHDWDKLAYESELLLAQYKNVPLEIAAKIETRDLPKEGKEREALIRVRVNQSFFRSAILSSYESTCCITGMKIPELLVASHIVPWSSNLSEAANPENGLCLNALHDRAFDRGLLTISEDFKVILSDKLLSRGNEDVIKHYFIPYHQKDISKPNRFLPAKEFLHYHRSVIFNNLEISH